LRDIRNRYDSSEVCSVVQPLIAFAALTFHEIDYLADQPIEKKTALQTDRAVTGWSGQTSKVIRAGSMTKLL
jgi:hypothetical protein